MFVVIEWWKDRWDEEQQGAVEYIYGPFESQESAQTWVDVQKTSHFRYALEYEIKEVSEF